MGIKKQPVIAAQIRTTQENLDQLDKYAEKMQLSRNQLMCNLISIGLEDLSVFDRLGLLRVGMGVRNLIDTIRNTKPDEGQLQPK